MYVCEVALLLNNLAMCEGSMLQGGTDRLTLECDSRSEGRGWR